MLLLGRCPGLGFQIIILTVPQAFGGPFLGSVLFSERLASLGARRMVTDNVPTVLVLFEEAPAAGLDLIDELLGNSGTLSLGSVVVCFLHLSLVSVILEISLEFVGLAAASECHVLVVLQIDVLAVTLFGVVDFTDTGRTLGLVGFALGRLEFVRRFGVASRRDTLAHGKGWSHGDGNGLFQRWRC